MRVVDAVGRRALFFSQSLGFGGLLNGCEQYLATTGLPFCAIEGGGGSGRVPIRKLSRYVKTLHTYVADVS